MKGLYFYIHLFTMAYPIAQSFEHRLRYYKNWKHLFPAIFLTGVFFIVWDVIFTLQGVWGFNDSYISGIKLFHLPVEEWLFFVTVPFASVFIYECIIYFIPQLNTGKHTRYIALVVGLILLMLAFLHTDKSYTFWNFLFAGLLLLGIYWTNPQWQAKAYLAYLIDLIPFLLVNGLLTGSFIDEPVVWYNNDHNLSIRIFTIPVEDTMYALLLLLMNISWYEYFKKTRGTKNIRTN